MANLQYARSRNPLVPKDNNNGSKAEGSKAESKGKSVTTKAATLGEATSVLVAPKAFSMNSTLLWQAREAAIREWGWDPDLSAEDFLDTFLYIAFKQRGIILGGYTVLARRNDHDEEYEEEDNGG